jgi:nitroreductase
MTFIELAKKRYSSRKYQLKAIEPEKLNLILEAGRIAPSANNAQPWIFIVVKGENLENLRMCYHRDWFKTASTYIVLCADHSQSWKRSDGKNHGDIDVAIAADHMTLAATSIGLASCWVCNFNRQLLVEKLELPNNYEPIVILPLGYPTDDADAERHSTKRKSLNQLVHFEKFSP